MYKLKLWLRSKLDDTIYWNFTIGSVFRGLLAGLTTVICFLLMLAGGTFLLFEAGDYFSFANSTYFLSKILIIFPALLSFYILVFVNKIFKGNFYISATILTTVIILSVLLTFAAVAITVCTVFYIFGQSCI